MPTSRPQSLGMRVERAISVVIAHSPASGYRNASRKSSSAWGPSTDFIARRKGVMNRRVTRP